MMRKLWLSITTMVLLSISVNCKAGTAYEDLRAFVKTNPYYNHFLVVASSIVSYRFFSEQLQNQSTFNANTHPYVAFTGAYVVSSLVKENPGYSTLLGLGYFIYSLLK